MNQFTFAVFDEDQPKHVGHVHMLVRNYVMSHFEDQKAERSSIENQILDGIENYQIRAKIVFDGADVVGLIVHSKYALYQHLIIYFMHVEEAYQRDNIYSEILDAFSDSLENPKLAMLSPTPVDDIYLNSGFAQAKMKNVEKALVYFRNKDGFSGYQIDEYLQKHRKYMKGYVRYYWGKTWLITISSLALFVCLVMDLADGYQVFSYPITYVIFGVLLLASVALVILSKRFNKKGKETFGFEYNYYYVSQNQYRFKSKFEEFVLASIKAYNELS